MSHDTETMVAAIKQVEAGLLDTVRARQEEALAKSMAQAIAIQKLTADAHSALRAALKDRNYIPTAPIIEPLLMAVHGVLATAPDEAPRKVSVPDNAVIDDTPTFAAVEDAEPVEPVKRTRKRKPTLAGVKRQVVKAGVEAARYDFRPDGTISVVPGKPVGGIDMDDTASPDPKWN